MTTGPWHSWCWLSGKRTSPGALSAALPEGHMLPDKFFLFLYGTPAGLPERKAWSAPHFRQVEKSNPHTRTFRPSGPVQSESIRYRAVYLLYKLFFSVALNQMLSLDIIQKNACLYNKIHIKFREYGRKIQRRWVFREECGCVCVRILCSRQLLEVIWEEM